MIHLNIAPLSKHLYPLLDLIFLLRKVIIKLINKLLTLLETSNMPLSPAVPLGLNHLSPLK